MNFIEYLRLFLYNDINFLLLCFYGPVVMARGEHPIHSELGRENPQRRWYFVLRHGRVGRCPALKTQLLLTRGGAAS